MRSQLSAGFHQTTIAWMERFHGKHLSLVLRRMREMSKRHGLRCANVFHAGDGNLHPLILFDANNPTELKRAEDFGAEILELCVEVGGTITGEHGVELKRLMRCVFSSPQMNSPSFTP